MLIRALNKGDIPAWLALAHEYDDEISKLTTDMTAFYKGFDEYMAAKVNQNEAYAVAEEFTGRFLGVVAFSKKNNRITFLSVSRGADFLETGAKLMETAVSHLDNTMEITANVFKSDAEIFQKERSLFEDYGFIASDETVMESGVPAYKMKTIPAGKIG